MTAAAAAAVEFDPAAHRYTLNGKPLPSVTRVLDPLSAPSFIEIPRHILEAARVFGGHVHDAVHLFNMAELDESSLHHEVARYLDGYKNFLTDRRAVVIVSEARVHSVEYGYAGTLDTAIRYAREDVLLDLKTSHAVPRTVGPQTAGYKEAANSSLGLKLRKRFCLHLNPAHARGYKFFPLTDPGDWSVFISALNIHNWHARGKNPVL